MSGVRLAAMGAVWLACSPAYAGDLLVPGAYSTIQDAIDDAVTGDRILVASGTYAEMLTFPGTSLLLEGDNGGGAVVVQSPYASSTESTVIVVAGGEVTLRGIQVDGAAGRRGIEAYNGARLTLDRVAVRNGVNSDGEPGAGLHVWGAGSALVRDSFFEHNTATMGPRPLGAHIAVEPTGSVELAGSNELNDGLAARGGAIWIGPEGAADVAGVTFAANTAAGAGDNDGGAICAERRAALSVAGCTFDTNLAGMDGASYGGAIYSAADLAVVQDSTFVTNRAHAGGGIGVEDGALASVGNVFVDNLGDKGGGIACIGALACTSTGSSFSGNEVNELGGAIYLWSSGARVDGDTFCSNTVNPMGSPWGFDGGAIRQAGGDLEVRNTVFMGNVAAQNGGAIAMSDGVLDSMNNHYLANRASYGSGGALHAIDTQGLFSRASSLNDLFVENQGASDGAVGFAPGLLNTVDFAFLWNNVPDPGSIGILPTNYVNTGDPQLNGWAAPSCNVEAMRPAGGSPLIDRGSLIHQDADGSRSDIGAFGGAGRTDNGNVIDDGDGDGIPSVLDCNDADGTVGLPSRWHPDADGDGYGDWTISEVACDPPDPSWTTDGGDCDDGDASRHPDTLWYPDRDGDGWAGDEGAVPSCEQPAGFLPVAEDCHDGQASIHPGAAELCDGVDQDCDGVIDEDPVDAATWYTDADGDGWGDPKTGVKVCEPTGVSKDGDCDDTDPAVHPGAEDDWYDGVDSNCDGLDDYDADRDGFPVEHDCRDHDPSVNPDAEEIFDDGVDSDCDGVDGRTWLAGGGCACDGSGGTPGAWMLLAALGLIGRRRRALR